MTADLDKELLLEMSNRCSRDYCHYYPPHPNVVCDLELCPNGDSVHPSYIALIPYPKSNLSQV